MKKIIFSIPLLASLFLADKAYSFDASVRGFIALDAFNYEKIEGQKGSSIIGIGVLDLKVFAEKDNLSAAIKLDLDGRLEQRNNIFEEAYVTYKGIPNTRIMLGKGVVRFQNLHWGAVVNSYQDGGTVISADNSYRKLSRKAFIAASYGSRQMGFINQFTLWGDSLEIDTDQETGAPIYTTSGSGANRIITGYRTRDVKAFDTKKQLGLANKFDYFFSNNFKMNFSQLYYKNKLHDRYSYAFDIGANYESAQMEIWMDLLYGFTSKLPYESYTSAAKTEYFLQLGMEYYLNEKWSLVNNVEGLLIKDRQHTYTGTTVDGTTYVPSSQQAEKSNTLVESFTYKIETGVKYKLTRSAHLTIGGLFEQKIAKKDGIKDLLFIRDVRNSNREAYKFITALSFWF